MWPRVLLVCLFLCLFIPECTVMQSQIGDFFSPGKVLSEISGSKAFSRCSETLFEAASASQDFFIGAASGGVASFLVFPIDLAKTRMQDQIIHTGTKAAYRNTFQTITKVARNEGLRTVYHGVVPVLVGSAPSSALQLGGNARARELLAARLGVEQRALPLPLEALAGGFGGLCQVAANNPMESVKIIKQVPLAAPKSTMAAAVAETACAFQGGRGGAWRWRRQEL